MVIIYLSAISKIKITPLIFMYFQTIMGNITSSTRTISCVITCPSPMEQENDNLNNPSSDEESQVVSVDHGVSNEQQPSLGVMESSSTDQEPNDQGSVVDMSESSDSDCEQFTIHPPSLDDEDTLPPWMWAIPIRDPASVRPPPGFEGVQPLDLSMRPVDRPQEGYHRSLNGLDVAEEQDQQTASPRASLIRPNTVRDPRFVSIRTTQRRHAKSSSTQTNDTGSFNFTTPLSSMDPGKGLCHIFSETVRPRQVVHCREISRISAGTVTLLTNRRLVMYVCASQHKSEPYSVLLAHYKSQKLIEHPEPRPDIVQCLDIGDLEPPHFVFVASTFQNFLHLIPEISNAYEHQPLYVVFQKHLGNGLYCYFNH